MDLEKLTQRLIGIFLGELDEHVSALGENVLALEKLTDTDARMAVLADLFRTAHSLKGAAGSVSVTPVVTASHYLEEIISRSRLNGGVMSSELIELLLETADAIGDIGRRLSEGTDLTDAPLMSLLPRLEAAVEGEGLQSRPVRTRGDRRPAKPPAAATVAEQPRSPEKIAAEPASRTAPETSEPPGAARGARSASPASAEPTALASSAPATQRLRRSDAEEEPRLHSRSRRTESRAGVLIPADRLDRLLARGDEMLIARRRSTFHGAAVAGIQETLRKVTRTRGSAGPARDGAADLHAGVLAEVERDLALLAARIASDQHLLEQIATPFDEEVRSLRMSRFAEACEGLERAARDLARDGGKEVEVVVVGGQVEVDRTIVDALRSPIVQLVRNAVAHGIEPPDERERAGKPRQGRITVAASLSGSRVHLSVRDDGRGINLEEIRSQAVARGIPVPQGEASLAGLIFEPGLSTAAAVTDAAGRGIGLDIVRSRIEGIGGSITLKSTPGTGAEFSLSVPLTLTTIRALLLRSAGETFAIENSAIAAVARIPQDEIRSVEGRDVATVGNDLIPLVRLSAVLGFGDAATHDANQLNVVALDVDRSRIGVVVDELLTEQDLVVKSIGKRLVRLRNISGATLLPDGSIALILNASDLTRSIVERRAASLLVPSAGEVRRRRKLLVVDDSVTTRALEKSILEAAGYDVIAAADGAEAWRLLQQTGADLIVSDVEMPRMDGFALTETIRNSGRFRDLPVVLVTALETDEGKERGMQVGADAYLLKSSFDQTRLLETIAQLI